MTTHTTDPIGRIMLKNVRLSFPALFTPEAFKPGDPLKYKATFLVPKGDPQVKAIEAAILAALKAKYPAKADSILKSIRGNPNKFCWQDGDAKEYDGYEGMMALSAKASVRPAVIDRDRSPLAEADGKPYAGCYVNASVEFFAYDSSGVGVSAGLRGVQFMNDGDSFAAGRPADSNEFEEVTSGADADEFA
jgi:Protein of unknown function (DUF2815)